MDTLPRSGRKPDITEAARTWLVGEACAKIKDRGYPHKLWTFAKFWLFGGRLQLDNPPSPS
jgi:hypothetical protein